MTSTTYGSRDFAAAMKGATLSATPPTDGDGVLTAPPSDDFATFALLTGQFLQTPNSDVDKQLRNERLRRLADRSTSDDGLDRQALRRKK